MRTKLTELFEEETLEFDLEYAFLARIDQETETVHFEIVHGANAPIETRGTAPLPKTFCQKTIEHPNRTLSINDAVAEGWEDDPAFEELQFRSYLGTTVFLDDEPYGTLCFADAEPRSESFSEAEISLIEMLGQWVSYELSQWSGPPTHDTISENLDEREIPMTPQIDSMMEALGKRSRRYILLELLEVPSNGGLPVAEMAEALEGGQIKLRHAHLPKLEQTGYIEWDRASNVVRPGPNFSEVAPLLRLLKDYTNEFSKS